MTTPDDPSLPNGPEGPDHPVPPGPPAGPDPPAASPAGGSPADRPDPISAVGNSAVSSWQRMLELLFTGPNVSVRNWFMWGLIALLAGATGSGGGDGNVSTGVPGGNWNESSFDGWDMGFAIAMIVTLIAIAILLAIVFWFVRSCMRFVLIDGLLSGAPRIREPFSRALGPGLRYFLFELALAIGCLLLPALFGLILAGLVTSGAPTPIIVLAGISFGLTAVISLLVFTVISWIVYDLALPYAWRSGSITGGLGEAFGLIRRAPLALLLFLLARLAVGVLVAAALMILFVATCCIWIPGGLLIAGPLVGLAALAPATLVISIPIFLVLFALVAWLMATLTAPVTLFQRGWSLAMIGELDPDMRSWMAERGLQPAAS